jgi:hypothetical protein
MWAGINGEKRMTELKTHKEIWKEVYKNGLTREEAEELERQEAIKWVKDCSGSMKWTENKKRCLGCQLFMKFFNITEEDLQEEKQE